jgi:hypothetical protein
MQEGFISFNYNGDSLDRVSIPQYSSGDDSITPYKLYDSLYFDDINGNLLEVDSNEYEDGGNVDLAGNTITSLSILPRNSVDVYTYTITSTDTVVPDQPTSLLSSYSTLIYRTESDATDDYTVFYIPWDKRTFVHIVNTSPDTPLNVYSYLFSNTSTVYSKNMNNSPLAVTAYIQDIDSNNNSEVIEPNYNSSRKVYQISKYVKYDMKNGNLLVTNSGSSQIKVYKRNQENLITINVSDSAEERTFGNDEGYQSVSDYSVRVIEEESGGSSVLFMCNSFDSVVAIIAKNANGDVVINNLKRFNPNGIDTGSVESTTTSSDSTTSSTTTSTTATSTTDAGDDELDLSNYILKTQVVPPVCPSCPACPSLKIDGDSICSNCGGAGGSGTLSNNGNSTVAGDSSSQNQEEGRNLINTVGGAASNTVGAVGDIASTGVDAVGGVASSAVGAVGDFASTTVGAVGDVASSLIDSGGNVISTASNQPTTSLSTNTTSQTSGNENQETTTYQSDPYSYYGQIPHRPTNEFLPRTADFSTFGR